MGTTRGYRELWGKTLFVLLLIMAAWPASATIWYVAPDGTGSGTSWQEAGPLQATVNAATSGDEIWVAAGTYTAATDPVLTMKVGVALYGGFTGTESERGQRDWQTNVTSIDGQDTRRCVNGAADVVLDGFVITRGKSPNNGGGMYNQNAKIKVINCIFTGNSAVSDGGGMYNATYIVPTITDCIFTGNSASFGGGMYNRNASPTVTNCIFDGNDTDSTVYVSWGGGGGMYNHNCSPTLTNCTFTDNLSSRNGGGIYNHSSKPNIADCNFTGNFASSWGGGMYSDSSSPAMSNTTFTDNEAYYGGGIHNVSSSSTVTTINCTFTGNIARSNGGGIYNDGASFTATNCILAKNRSEYCGGGIYNKSASSTVMNCTLSENTAIWGGGIYNEDSLPTVTNSILWGNYAFYAQEIFGDANTTYSCIKGGFSGTGNLDAVPMLMATPGTPRLHPQSPCIDAGTSDGAPSTDIEGTPRPQGAGLDMGAYEGIVAEEDVVVLTINTSPAGAGITTPPEGQYYFERGHTVDLAAQGIGTMFMNWSGALYGETPEISLLMDTDKTVTATFTENIYYVNANSTVTTPDGRSWESAFGAPQEAIDLAYEEGGGEVWLSAGVYYGTMIMKAGVALYGGFSGVEEVREKRDWQQHETMMDGQEQNNCVTGANHAILDGFTLTRGIHGMYNVDASPIVGNCRFENNGNASYLSGVSGGGMANENGSSPLIMNCSFISNKAVSFTYYHWDPFCECDVIDVYPGMGAGVFNQAYSSPTLINCIFAGNSVNYSGKGSAIGNYSLSSCQVINCTFVGNSGAEGVIWSDSRALSVTNSIFWGNVLLNNQQISAPTPVVSYSCIQGGYEGVGNIGSDPVFANDYRLQSGSPCIDSGTSEGVPDADTEGMPRPQGAGWDMGAYEFVNLPPQVTLAGKEELTLACDAPYVEVGLASVLDARDGEVVDLVDPASVPVLIWQQAALVYASSLLYIEDDFNNPEVIARPVEPAQETYTLTYEVTARAGGPGTASRIIRLECPLSEEGEAPEGEIMEEGETPVEGEGEAPAEGEVLPEGEGEMPAEGEGETPAEGEVLPEGEGEIPAEGEGETPAEGEVLPEGEGETPAEGEGEGEVLPEGEGEVLVEGEGEATEGEPEGEGEDDACGCCASTDKHATPELLKRILGDWLIVGTSLLVLMSMSVWGRHNM